MTDTEHSRDALEEMLRRLVGDCSADDIAAGLRALALNLARCRAHLDSSPVPAAHQAHGAAELAPHYEEALREVVTLLAGIAGRQEVIEGLQPQEPGSPLARTSGKRERTIAHRFHSQRFFYHASVDGNDDGWYFSVRGGLVYGPFPTETDAKRILQGLLEHYRRVGETGGR